MQNPWLSLPSAAPFVLEMDRPVIDLSNRLFENAVQTHILPVPFLGNRDAPVVWVLLNPGFAGDEAEYHDLCQPHDMRNLRHESDLYLLDESMGATPGGRWHRKKLNALIRDVGLERVRRGIFMIEFFPYHSRHGANLPLVPSQAYTLALIEAAIKRRALLILGRSPFQRLFADYPNAIRPRSARQAALSPGNINEYDRIVTALSSV